MKSKKQRGFTLFELLVSISIIGILTALGVVSFSNAQKKARDSRRIQDMDAIQKAAEMYYSQNSSVYPTTVAAMVPTFIQSAPFDPKTKVAYSITLVGGGVATGVDYCACATLENPLGNSDVLTCASFVSGSGAYYCVKSQQ